MKKGAVKMPLPEGMQTIGGRIRTYRKIHNMKQKTLAKILNISTATLSRWENNEQSPDAESIIIISKELDIDLLFLLTGEKHP
jgi:transcriptional regulator with XRE-family HTH domain